MTRHRFLILLRPDLIDPALLRPGRFDKLLYVEVNSDPSYRERVLKALTRKFQLREDVSLYSIAKKCPPNFTGANMYALCADAWFHAAKRKVLDSCLDSAGADDQTDSVIVEYNDFVKEYRVLPMNYKAYGVLPVGVEENFQSMVGFVGAVFASVCPIYRLISV